MSSFISHVDRRMALQEFVTCQSSTASENAILAASHALQETSSFMKEKDSARRAG